jgi:hypothetical protein
MNNIYTQDNFKNDVYRIKKLLPKKLRQFNINFVGYGIANFNNGININLDGIINKIELKKAIELYLKKKLSIRQYVLLVFLHELGHYFNHISGLSNTQLYRQQSYFIEDNLPYIQRQLNYWKKITEEQEAWNFSKKYFSKLDLTK